MKRALVVVALLGLVGFALASAEDEKAIREVLSKNAAGWSENNAALLSEVLSEDVVFTENGGLNAGRASVLEHVKQDHAAVRSLKLSTDVQRLTRAGDFAWVYAIERAEMAPQQGEPFALKSHSIMVLQKVQGRWWIVAHSLSARRERPRSN